MDNEAYQMPQQAFKKVAITSVQVFEMFGRFKGGEIITGDRVRSEHLLSFRKNKKFGQNDQLKSWLQNPRNVRPEKKIFMF